MSDNTRWKCPTTGSIIDFEPTPENFWKYRRENMAFAMAAMKSKDGAFIVPAGTSPWDFEVMMIQYTEQA